MASQGMRQAGMGPERRSPRPQGRPRSQTPEEASAGGRPGPGRRPPERPEVLGGFRLTGLLAVLVLIAVTAVGALLNGLAGGAPGLILYLSLIIGTLAATLLVEPRLVWLLIPAPALIFPVMAFAAGIIGGQHTNGSKGQLASAAIWVAKGFIAMATATLLAVLVTVVRTVGRRS